MNINVEIIRVDGSREQHEIEKGELFGRLYTLLDCDTIEPLAVRGGRFMLMDEDGLLIKKPINPEATALYIASGWAMSEIRGDVALVAHDDFLDNTKVR